MMKKFVKILSAMMLLLVVACGKTTKTDEPSKVAGDKVDVVATEKLVVNEDVEFKVMHVNDIHGRVDAGKYDGMGLARVSTMVKQTRAEDPNVLFLDAGDTIHGTVFAALTKGASVVRVMNEMGYDAMTTGNHDYNYGLDRIEKLQNTMNFPVLVSNLTYKDTGEKAFKPYTIKTLPNGVRVGIFGLATPETAYKTNPTNVEAVTFDDPIASAKESVTALKAEGVNYIVALSHLGVDEDSVYTSIKLAQEVDGIDLVVDGHSHTTLEEGMWVKDTLIVQSGFYDKNLGEVTIKLGKDGSKVETAKLFTKEYAMENVEEDPAVRAIIDEVNTENEKITSVVVGETPVLLDGERNDVRAGETNLGDMITEAMLTKTGAEGVITNGGGIRASIQKGTITRGDVISVLPFGNYVVVKEITGQDLKDAIENGVQSYPDARGAFPHVAGFTFKFDPMKEVGNKVYDVTFNNGEKLDLTRTYKIATNDFMAVGGDKYASLKGKKTVNEYESIEEILGEYIKTNGITHTTVDGRVFAGKEEITANMDKKSNDSVYTVESGDTLRAISEKTGIDMDTILKENKKITNPDIIFIGEKIALPKAN
ncbi:5'-nucleotidase C-terminal domain-containing protein [Psychrilyobacter atlanticus]|uniref:5'-nucleotidase C-terminal domain-containing protein n=1 Tax=Psychrilyobacter atlanticus TaxID=271091 RepID=UPI00048C67D3|nr:5'-nucleotidase C-terminal domain-containing protein [Psychrilyobacter atlanticus]